MSSRNPDTTPLWPRGARVSRPTPPPPRGPAPEQWRGGARGTTHTPPPPPRPPGPAPRAGGAGGEPSSAPVVNPPRGAAHQSDRRPIGPVTAGPSLQLDSFPL